MKLNHIYVYDEDGEVMLSLGEKADEELEYNFADEIINGDKIVDIISQVRGEKSNQNVSLKTPVSNLTISVDNKLESAINECIKDFRATLFIENLETKLIDKDYEVYNVELNLEENAENK